MSAAVATATLATTVPAAAATRAAPLPLLRLAPDDAAPASVLGLDGKDGEAADKLTAALRKAFANRGLTGGEEISLEEMRLTMGCTNDGVACLAEGGDTLGVGRLVFGYLSPAGGGYQLDIQILDVGTASLSAQASLEISKADLADGAIDATAARVVNELMPPADADTDMPPPPDPLPETDPEDDPVEEPPKEGAIYFGLEKPTPRWKWVGFGTSLGLTVALGGATAGMAVWLTMKNGGFRSELLDAAEASLQDEKTINDVDPNLPEGFNLCEYARARPTDSEGNLLGQEGEVRNADVATVCNKGDAVQTAQLATGIGTAVFGVATLAFTGLLLIHKRKPTADAMLRRKVRLGIAPNIQGGGGLTFAGGLKF